MLTISTLLQSILAVEHSAGNSFSAPSLAAPPELAPDEIGRRLDRAVRLDRDREGRAVVEHEDADRRIVGLLRRKFDQRVDVAEAHVVGAIGDLRHGRAGAVALVEGDVEAFLLEVAAVLRQEEHSLRPLILPVQHHPDFGLRLCRSREAGGEGQSERKRLHSTKRVVSDHRIFPVRSGIRFSVVSDQLGQAHRLVAKATRFPVTLSAAIF